MRKKCKKCAKEFDDSDTEFCSHRCEDEYLLMLKKKLDEAIKSDTGHTKNMSKQ